MSWKTLQTLPHGCLGVSYLAPTLGAVLFESAVSAPEFTVSYLDRSYDFPPITKAH
jgi:hypothetical protein